MPNRRPAGPRISGSTSASIADSIERAVREGALGPGATLPTVRGLASTLSVSTSTVADAYRSLRQKGVVRTDGRRGTAIAKRPPLTTGWSPAPQPAGVHDLADGNPDPALLPSLGRLLRTSVADPALYGDPRKMPELVRAVVRELRAQGIDADDVAIVGGAIDGIGRVLQAHLGPGDRVAVEDPTFPPLFDLLGALGLVPEPVGSDRDGPLPATLETALRRGAEAAVLTSRAQNPTGAAVSPERSRDLRRVLQRHADVLVIEDDTGGLATEDQLASVIDTSRPRWAFVRSFSMVFGPDLRTAIIAADEVTLARVEGRQWVSGGWVSHILQRLAWRLLTDGATMNRVRKARSTYGIRRQGLVDALAECGIEVSSRSGFNVWIPVAQESATISSLQAAGWGVAAGEPFRLKSPAGIRVTASRLTRGDSKAFAAALADSFQRRGRTYGG